MNKKGFTLIELLVVIVILAIIALITVPNALAMITTAQERADARSADAFFRAAEVYCLKHTTASATLGTTPANFTYTAGPPVVGSIPAGIDVKGANPTAANITFGASCTVTGSVTYGTSPAVTRS